jgi:hypothetical protein
MNASKLNDWLQMTAAVGVITGLILVAYEIRVSNRIGLDQANSESLSRYNEAIALASTAEAADIFIRSHEGDVLSRQEMLRLDVMLNAYIGAMYYDWTLSESGTLSYEQGFAKFYAPAFQWYLGSEIGRRKWDTDSGDWETPFAEIIDSALADPKQRNVLAELDYLRGAADSAE